MPNLTDFEKDSEILTEKKEKLEKPKLFKVILHNDDFTTMEFVVFVLMDVFHHSENEAIRIMLQVHNQGMGVAGVYTFEIAETKAAKVITMAQENEYPLLCTLEEE